MGTENFSRVQPRDGYGENIKPVQQAWGDPVTGIARVNHPGDSDTIKPAGLFSTAPYRGPEAKKVGPRGCVGKDGTCQVAVKHGTDYCIFHTPRIKH